MLKIVYMYARTFYMYTYIGGGAGRTAAGAARNGRYTSIHICIYVYIYYGMYACTLHVNIYRGGSRTHGDWSCSKPRVVRQETLQQQHAHCCSWHAGV